MQWGAGAAGDVDHLGDGVEQPVPLVPNMGHERHAEGGGLLGDRDELVGGGVGGRQVDEPEREHAGTRLEAEANLASHVAQALGVRLDPPASEHQLAHGTVADRGHERERGPGGVERVEVLRRPSTTAMSRDRRPRAAAGTPGAPIAARGNGGGREAVGIDHLGREALRELRGQERVVERPQRGVRVQVDEARAEHQPAPVDDLARLRRRRILVTRCHKADRRRR